MPDGLGPGALGCSERYLQTESITRVLVLRLPRVNPPPGTKQGDLVRANGSRYGTKDAGRNWYRYLMRTLRSKDFRESALERGLYALRDEHGPCIVMRSHVDDLAVAIGRASNRAKAEMAYITGVLHMVRSKDNIYCGKALEILQDRIIVRQTAAISAVEAVDLPRERRSQPQTPLLPTRAQPVLRHAWPGAMGC